MCVLHAKCQDTSTPRRAYASQSQGREERRNEGGKETREEEKGTKQRDDDDERRRKEKTGTRMGKRRTGEIDLRTYLFCISVFHFSVITYVRLIYSGNLI